MKSFFDRHIGAFTLLILALVSYSTFAATEVTRGSWALFTGTSKVSEHTSESACLAAAPLGKHTCRTITTVVVTTDPPKPPDPIPEPPKPVPTDRPTAANTGAKGELKPLASCSIAKPGVYENFTCGSVTVNADNVTLRNCRIKTSSSYGIKVNAKNLLVESCEISGMSSAAIYGGNFTARRLYVHDSGADGFKPTGNAVIEDSYIEKMGYLPEAHADGVQMVSGKNVVIRGNNFNMAKQPGFKNSQVIIIQSNNGPVSDILVENNWFNGGGYTLQFRDKKTGYGAPTNVTIRNNKFGKDYQFGPWSIDGATKPCSNTWEDGALMSQNGKC